MKKIFLRGSIVVATMLLTYSIIVFLSLSFPSTGSKNTRSWLPNFKSTSGGAGHTLLRLQEAERVTNVDILFVGSSQVFRGFDIRVFKRNGIHAFNLGTSAQTLFNSYYLLKEYLPTMNPKYVVLDLYWGVADDDGVEPSIDILSNSDLDESTVEMVIDLENATVFESLFATLISRIHTPLHRIPQKELDDFNYVSGGFTESALTRNRLNTKELKQIEPIEATLTDFQYEYLQKIISLCESHNTELIFVVAPVTKELKSKVLNYDSYTSKISRLARDNNIPYFDYNERKELSLISTTDFADRNHLNQSGAEKFNELLIRDLRSLGVTSYSSSRR